MIKYGLSPPLLHHPDTFTVRTDPCWSITDSPFIFLKTDLANLEPTGATPAELLFLFAAVATIFT